MFICQEMSGQTDSLFTELDSSTVWTRKNQGFMKPKSGGILSLDMKQMDLLPKILGTADPVHYASLLPGVQTASEMDGSVHILGSENAHNFIALGSVPIYGSNHLLGLFSVFNSDHFESMDFNRNAQGVSRLGGELRMELKKKIPEKVTISTSLGPVAAQATAALPLNRKTAVFVSGRRSFLNQVYHNLLTVDNTTLEYGFTDLNATVLFKPGKNDIIIVNGYYGNDDASTESKKDAVDTWTAWGNKAASVDWIKQLGAVTINQTAYITSYSFDGKMDLGTSSLRVPSSIQSCAYKVSATAGGFRIQDEIIRHKANPQTPQTTGTFLINNDPEHQKGVENTFYASYGFRLHRDWKAELGLGVPALFAEGRNYIFADPSASITYQMYERGKITLDAGLRHQMLFQTGFTDMGLPTEFWFLAGRHADPQSSAYINAEYSRNLGHGEWEVRVCTYYRHLTGQIEYKGTPFDLISTTYSLDDVLLKGNGDNFGANIILTRNVGPVTGWICYSFGKALRKFPELSQTRRYPANHERVHEFDGVATWKKGDWDFGGTLVLASGRPFTPADYIYLYSKQILVDYGEHNSDRLPIYARLDLSANWNCFKTRFGEGGVNFSLYNALGCPNIYSYTIHFSERSDSFSYMGRKSFMRFLPSISVYFKI